MQMARCALWFALAATLPGCRKGPASRVATPPVAPTPPPPAPDPSPEAAPPPPESEYERLRAMDVDAINRMGLLADIHFEFDRAEILAADVGTHLLRTLAAAGVVLSEGLLKSLLAAYQREAEDAALRASVAEFLADPLGPQLVPNWARVWGGVHEAGPQLLAAVQRGPD